MDLTLARRSHREPLNPESEGYALVSVLWLVTLLTIIVASYHSSARYEARLGAQYVHGMQGRYRAEAALWIAISSALGADSRNLAPRSEQRIVFDGRDIEVSIAAATGKVNLNRAGVDLLERLVLGAGQPSAEKTALVDAILDWRDADDAPRLFGAEDFHYADRGHEANDAPFATVDEVRHVLGMTEAVFREIEPHLTVFGDHAFVNADAAEEETLLRLLGGDDARVAAYLRGRAEAHSDFDGLDSLSTEDRIFARRARTDVYMVRSVAHTGSGAATVEATVRIPTRGSDSVLVLAWN